MDLFSFLSFHFMCVTVTVVTSHSVALSRRSHLFSTMSSLHDVLVHDRHINIQVSYKILQLEVQKKALILHNPTCFQEGLF
jgi:hypothetical protein